LRGSGAKVEDYLHLWVETLQRFLSEPDGFVSLPVFAMAIRGRDNGFPIEVESDYLPGNLVNATWSNR
jgi:hypothetical protein